MDLAAFDRQLQTVTAHAQRGDFAAFIPACARLRESGWHEPEMLLRLGATLMAFGFSSEASECFERMRVLSPDDLRPLVNLANVAQQQGRHRRAGELYATLLDRLPDEPLIRRNLLTCLEYDPDTSAEQRLRSAQAWGTWAVARAGGGRERPPLRNSAGPLRVGYVSADFCQHTVGLLVKDVLAAHDPERVSAHAYSSGEVSDWVTASIRQCTRFQDVAGLTDMDLAALIERDRIDVLVDLSGHTAGSRLTAFAYRPAPVQVSWLGYFATTGLPAIDAVLLDEWHAPEGTQQQFVEHIVALPRGRICYTPVPFAPAAVSPLPASKNGHVTFGSFNNTAKYNDEVFDVWAQVLLGTPDSRLVLKWRTFQDFAFQEQVRTAFAQRGVDPARLELRGASFHADVLNQYADIDIALDPFPFSGGMTSCEALWMGVPVVTWPQERVVSRQTFAFLSAIRLAEFAAVDASDYVRIAKSAAADPGRLAALREGMRDRMRTSPLCDVKGFTAALERTYLALRDALRSTGSPVSGCR